MLEGGAKYEVAMFVGAQLRSFVRRFLLNG